MVGSAELPDIVATFGVYCIGMRISPFLSIGLLCVVGASSAIQQPIMPTKKPQSAASKYPPGLTPPIVPRARLLLFPEVNKDLKVSAALAAKIKKEYDDPLNKKGAKPLPRDEMKAKWLAKEAKIISWLSAAQKSRLTQLSYQAIGILAVRSAPAVKSLGLTKAQDATLTKAWDEIYRRARAEARKHEPPKIDRNDPKRQQKIEKALDEHDAIYDKYHAEATRKAMTVLTAAQRAKWQAMQGKKFAFTRKMKR